MTFSLVMSMLLMMAADRAATVTGAVPPVTAATAARAKANGTAAFAPAVDAASTTPTAPAVMPRRISRSRSRRRAWSSRCRSVGSVQCKRPAACALVSPSRSQRTTGSL